jgi:hypothetical protein
MGFAMGRTIALKLTEKEDQIVTQLNKQGVTNSELLRNALRQYFEYLQESISSEQQEKNPIQRDRESILPVHESFEGLKLELEGLQVQTKKTKEQIESDIGSLQKQIHQLSIPEPVTKQVRAPMKITVVKDIHNEVDEFLKNRSHRSDLWKK